MSINFKSVGITGQQQRAGVMFPSLSPIGIKTPLEIGQKNGIFVMHDNLSEQMHDNLGNLILTNWGERLGHYFYGANLKPLTTDYSSEDSFDSEAVIRIKAAVAAWMPFIELVDYVSSVDRSGNTSTGVISIIINYVIQRLNVPVRSLKINLYIL